MARGLSGVELVTSDAHGGIKPAIATVLTDASWRRCRTHFMANLASRASWPMIATLARSIFEQPDHDATWAQVGDVVDKLTSAAFRLGRLLLDAVDDILAFTTFPTEHWPKIRSTIQKSDNGPPAPLGRGHRSGCSSPLAANVDADAARAPHLCPRAASHGGDGAPAADRVTDVGPGEGGARPSPVRGDVRSGRLQPGTARVGRKGGSVPRSLRSLLYSPACGRPLPPTLVRRARSSP